MPEFGGPEIQGPDESGGQPSEQLSEAAKERFAAQAAAMKQIQREEKTAKKGDDSVARAIVQFLGEEEHTHLFLLISRLVARDCPSVFILAILSLINDTARESVENFIHENNMRLSEDFDQTTSLTKSAQLPKEMNSDLMRWVTRMQVVMSLNAATILEKLIVDGGHIDGTVLQLSTFVLSEYFEKHEKRIPFEQLQPLTANILQLVFEPFLHHIEEKPESIDTEG